jgi:NADH-quinone oxidoreductase subunit L
MTVPLGILAFLSIVGGFIGIPHAIGHHIGIHHLIDEFLEGTVSSFVSELSEAREWMLMGAVFVLILGTIWLARHIFVTRKQVPVPDEKPRPLWEEVISYKYYVDEIFEALIVKPMDKIAGRLFRLVEVAGIDGLVNGVGTGISKFSSVLRLVQTGNIGTYILFMVLGMIVFMLLRFWGN